MTVISVRGGPCGEGEECPGVHRMTSRPDRLFVVAERIADRSLRAELLVDSPEGTLVGAVPAGLFPEARADRDPYPWLRLLPGHRGTVFVTGAAVADAAEAAMLARQVGVDEFAMSVPAVELLEV